MVANCHHDDISQALQCNATEPGPGSRAAGISQGNQKSLRPHTSADGTRGAERPEKDEFESKNRGDLAFDAVYSSIGKGQFEAISRWRDHDYGNQRHCSRHRWRTSWRVRRRRVPLEGSGAKGSGGGRRVLFLGENNGGVLA